MNTKKYKFFAFVCVVFALTSCSDYLDTPSKSALSDKDMYSTAANVDKMLTGVYGCLKPFSTYYFIMSENRSDNFFQTVESKNNSYADCSQFNATNLVSNSLIRDCWLNHYQLIAAANALIARQGEASNLSDELKRQYEAEARFLRALSYFDMVRFYGNIPVSLTVLTADEAFQLPQSEPLEVYNNAIVPDLLYAIDNLADKAVDCNGKIHTERATKLAAKALLGKVYMQMAGYPLRQKTKGLAQNLFKEVIDAWDFNNRWAKDINEWNRMWIHENDNKYFIFEIQYITEKDQGNPAAPLARPGTSSDDAFCSAYLTAGSHIYMNRELQNELTTGYDASIKDLDDIIDKRWFNSINIAQYYDEENAVYRGGNPNTDAFITKFFEHKMKRDSLGFGNMDASIIDRSYWPQNWPILRIEDIMLLYAECLGPVSDGYTYLNKTRTRAGLSSLSGLSAETFQQQVVQERRKELLGEGHRWFDQVRLNTYVQDSQHKFQYHYDNIRQDENYLIYITRVTQNSALYPIPLSQIRATGSLYKQNPGYN